MKKLFFFLIKYEEKHKMCSNKVLCIFSIAVEIVVKNKVEYFSVILIKFQRRICVSSRMMKKVTP